MAVFHTTSWSIVLASTGGQEEQQRAALEMLCRKYWSPVFSYVQSNVGVREEAEDLTQKFFTRLLERRWLAAADPARGRFRNFLLRVLKRFLVSEYLYARRQKRGGGMVQEPLDAGLDQVAGELTPDVEFDRKWALEVIMRAAAELRVEAAAAGQEPLFDALAPWLVTDTEQGVYAMAGAALGISRQGMALAMHRMRCRLRELIYQSVAQTLPEGGDVQAEVQELLAALRPGAPRSF